ncbi:MAG: TIGR02281 family clan AA aspartic protease [Methylococcales bacterium]|jgi:membrane protein required for colicin V production|nr:TIGR02281 family clan AA aspartic protease [Methylococcales bacterium]MBT7442444.1 TIGR02281 family clan AA aspartic protease [Methylococcales bacterium]
MINLTDFIFLLLIALSAVLGFSRGFIRESLSLAIWIITVSITLSFNKALDTTLLPYILQEDYRLATATAIIFLPLLIVLSIINRLIIKFFLRDGPDSHDHLLGLIFGTLRGLLVIVVVVILGGSTDVVEQQWWSESRVISYTLPALKRVRPYLPNDIGEYIDVHDRPIRTRKITLQADVNGHYHVQGKINGGPVKMLVDTGASLVSIPAHIAAQIGLNGSQTEQMMTAAGPQQVTRVTLESVQVGNIIIEQVQGAILPMTDSDSVLLGMSFLRRLHFTQSAQTLELEHKVR